MLDSQNDQGKSEKKTEAELADTASRVVVVPV